MCHSLKSTIHWLLLDVSYIETLHIQYINWILGQVIDFYVHWPIELRETGSGCGGHKRDLGCAKNFRDEGKTSKPIWAASIRLLCEHHYAVSPSDYV